MAGVLLGCPGEKMANLSSRAGSGSLRSGKNLASLKFAAHSADRRLTFRRPVNRFPSLAYVLLNKGIQMAEKNASVPAKAMSKGEIITALSEGTGLSKKDIASVFDELTKLIGENLGKKGPGVFNLPALMKVKVIRKPATKARKGINPFTKEETVFKAKPARNVVKVLPLKALKDMA